MAFPDEGALEGEDLQSASAHAVTGRRWWRRVPEPAMGVGKSLVRSGV